MYKTLAALIVGVTLFSGCGGPKPAAPAEAAPAPPAAAESFAEEGVQTELEPRKLGDFDVKALYTGELALGHFNFYVEGKDLKALRAWVGDEAATGAMICRANWEEDHYCAHIEMPTPIPAEAALWFEIETNDGKTHKASMPLAAKTK